MPRAAIHPPVRTHAGDKNVKRLGANVRRRRLDLGMSQEDLAHAAGLHPTVIGRLERGDREPRLGTIVVVSRALTVSPGKLLDGVR